MDKKSINLRFIAAVENLLQDKGLTKSAIADSLGVKPAKFSEILNNRMNAGADIIASLCEQYGYSASWLLIGRGSMLDPGPLPGRSKQAIAVPHLPDFPMTADGVCEMFLAIMKEKDERYKDLAEEIGALKERLKAYEIPKNSSSTAASQLEVEKATLLPT